MSRLRFSGWLVSLVLILTFTLPPRPAEAIFLWYGVSYNNWSFRHLDGTYFLQTQERCYYCVAAATQAWVDFNWVKNNNDYGHRYTQGDYWDGFFGSITFSWGSANIDLIAHCTNPTYWYRRRQINASIDDGVDPYGAGWGIYQYTPPGQYFHQNVYRNGTDSAYSFASHGIAYTLTSHAEPVGTLIDNGGHYVLTVAIEADSDPLENFWTPLRKVIYADPLLPPSMQQVVVRYDVPGEWDQKFTPYGWSGYNPTTPPFDEVDDVEVGPHLSQRGNFWWGHLVTIERDSYQVDPDFVYEIWD